MDTSENKEATIVLFGSIVSGLTGFLAAAPIPAEWKAPAITLTVVVAGAVLLFWKTKVNVPAVAVPV